MPEFIGGRMPVLEALRARKRRLRRLHLLRDGRGLAELRDAAGDLSISEHTRQELDKLLPGSVHQGVVLEAERLPVIPIETWLERSRPDDAIAVVLDEIEDPHNFGAIARSASAFGASALLFAQRRAAPISPASLKSAAGAMEHIDLVDAGNLRRAIDLLKNAGFWTAALDEDAHDTLWNVDLSGKIALIIGNEGRGLRRLTKKSCDFHVRIPLTGPIASLNASVSAAIALAECARRRQPAGRS